MAQAEGDAAAGGGEIGEEAAIMFMSTLEGLKTREPAPQAPQPHNKDMDKSGPPVASPRHYPLDLPNLPFSRYEHRRLTARDLLVNRIMAQIMSPAAKGADSRLLTASASCPVGFTGLTLDNPQLRADLELLRKMLYTTSVKKPVQRGSHMVTVSETIAREIFQDDYTHVMQVVTFDTVERDPWKPRATVEELAIDLVERHYLEQDDPEMRLLLQAQRPPPPTPSNMTSGTTVPGSHARLVKEYNSFFEARRKAEKRSWLDEDTELLRSLQTNARIAQANLLFDGGAFVPAMRQPLLACSMMQYPFNLHSLPFTGFVTHATWLDRHALPQWLRIPEWTNDGVERLEFMIDISLRHDFALGRAGRGLDRDGLWSSACRSGDTQIDRLDRNFRRRRATSEPPLKTFSAARLLHGSSRQAAGDYLLFPKMSLATLDRRSRRRSLSRTRIAEMFDWNTVHKVPQWRTASALGESVPQTTCRWQTPSRQSPKGNHLPGDRGTELVVASDEEPAKCHPQDPANKSANTLYPYQRMHTSNDDITVPATPGARSILANLESMRQKQLRSPCANCFEDHDISICHNNCGFCGAPNPSHMKIFRNLQVDLDYQPVVRDFGEPHLAPQCPVAAKNRCKCTPFPTYHVAAKCSVTCSRSCGNAHPTGSFKHRNAMCCKARCCMCGIKGHSGSQCKLKKCRCGEHHLGQDCGWKPECRVPGCTRYLCGIHCVQCGREKSKGGLVAGHCEVCLPNPSPENGKQKNKRKRKEKQQVDKGKPSPEDEGPSWLPLRPRVNVKTKKT